MDRRKFIRKSALATGIGLPFGINTVKTGMKSNTGQANTDASSLTDESSPAGDNGISAPAIDTNAYLFPYPFRTLKYGETERLIEKFRKHNISQAWVGSFESLFQKNIDYVNARLAKECREKGDGLLVPFGNVNPAFPDWKEDVRRCHEEYQMPGIRLFPNYQGYTLEDESFNELVQAATDCNMLVQIVVGVEDTRMQHPMVEAPGVDVTPLISLFREIPDANIQILHPFQHLRGDNLRRMVEETPVAFDISNLDATGSVRMILDGDHLYSRGLQIPSERLLLGSHFPYFPLENSLFKFLESPLSREEAELMLSANAERLLTGGK